MHFKHLLLSVVVCAMLSCIGVSAQEATGNESGIYPGFTGTPMLKSNGYKAVNGLFALNVGTPLQDLENVTDDDPDNFATSIGVADLTVGADERIKILVDQEYCTEHNIDPQTFGPGQEVGFVISLEGTKFSVLDLNLVKLFVIYFFKGDELVATKNGSSDELNVLGLNLVSGGVGKFKIAVTAPETDNNGNPLEFDGIGFGFGGVDVDVVNKLNIYYGYIDTFVTVPIIHKYYPKATSKTSGMVTGGKYLVNNDLSDGATTAVLNIGGAYYTVMSGEPEPFPAGVEAGFVMTAGDVLDLNLGKAVEIVALSYPQNPDGSYDFSAEPIEVGKTTDVNVVGLSLIGGGKTKVTMTTDVPCFGFRLNRITVLDLDLGANVVHYAYVKLPKEPEVKYPFVIDLDVIPGANFEPQKNGVSWGAETHTDAQNVYQNTIKLTNNAEHPLLAPEKYDDATRSKIWNKANISSNLNSSEQVLLTLERKTVTADGSTTTDYRYIYIVHVISPVFANVRGYKADKYYYLYDKNFGTAGIYIDGITPTELKDPDPTTGAINLDDVEDLVEDETREHFSMRKASTDDVVSEEYTLYFVPQTSTSSLSRPDNVADGYELDTDGVTVPQVKPEYQVAGTHTLEEIIAMDKNDTPASEIRAGKYGRYVIVTIPDHLDYKTRTTDVEIYKYVDNTKNTDWYYGEHVGVYSRGADGKWTAGVGAQEIVEQLDGDGASQIVLWDRNADDKDDYAYNVVCYVKLDEKYCTSHNVAQKENINYGCIITLVDAHQVPTLTSTDMTQYGRVIYTTWQVAVNKEFYNHEEGDGEILYSEWSTVWKEGSNRAIARSAADKTIVVTRDGETKQTTNLNDCLYFTSGYTNNGGPVHQATTTSEIHADDLPTDAAGQALNIENTARAYVPVRPAGYSDQANTYMVLQGTKQMSTMKETVTGIESVDAEAAAAGEAEFYTLQGQRVNHPAAGIYLRRTGSTVEKVVVK
ncbi:MAG: hypothetical protein K2M06_01010 [Muribaculaceae bacterium]|nr:hypothetical protein [Muribaculaceae bacterium]